jgi:hypothetical protein
MKANRGSRPLPRIAATALMILVAGCSEPRVAPAPTPSPTQRVVTAVPPSRNAADRSTADWRDAPITPGDWNWTIEGGQSVARFAGGALTIRCDRSSGAVVLQRASMAAGTGPAALDVTTTSGVRRLPATTQAGALVARLAPGDPALDAMIFSRGRFVVEAPGIAPLYVPSWPEVSRVAEDCRS